MTHGRDRREVLEVRIREDRAGLPQSVEATVVLALESCQVVVAELVDNDDDDQLGRGCGG